jgi:hypothetical protein
MAPKRGEKKKTRKQKATTIFYFLFFALVQS